MQLLKYILLFCFILQFGSLFCQTNKDSIFIDDEIFPQYKNGNDDILKVFADSMIYPETAIADKIEGKVTTSIKIDTLGNVFEIKLLRGIRQDVDNEALRLTSLIKPWTPGMQNGKKVICGYAFPIVFSLEAEFKRKHQ